MIRYAVVLGFSLIAALPAQASEVCEDLWFARGAILAQGGYCVTSPLGDAVFGNTDCDPKVGDIPAFLSEQLARIEEREAEEECSVDESAQTVDLWQVDVRKSLLIQPIRAAKERLCVMKAPTSLRLAPSPEADVLGWLERGDVVRMDYESAGGADFAARVRRGAGVAEEIGWFSASQCKPL